MKIQLGHEWLLSLLLISLRFRLFTLLCLSLFLYNGSFPHVVMCSTIGQQDQSQQLVT